MPFIKLVTESLFFVTLKDSMFHSVEEVLEDPSIKEIMSNLIASNYDSKIKHILVYYKRYHP